MKEIDLRDVPYGGVVHDGGRDRLYRKGRGDTWHPINRAGNRVGTQNAVRSDVLALHGPFSLVAS